MPYMVEVVRKEKESSTSLVRRFTRKTQQAGLVKEARRARYHRKPFSRFKKRHSALRRERVRLLYRRLLKAGIIESGEEISQQLKKKQT